MPVYANQIVLEMSRGAKAFLSVRAGITRGAVPGSGVMQTQELLERKKKRIEQLERAPEARDRRIVRLEGRVSIDPANLIWIFGTARTGSTWLGSMMEELENHAHWREPYVGDLFGSYYQKLPENRARSQHHILGRHRKAWLRSVRNFVLEGARARFPELGEKGYLIIKEPHGSHGAPLLMEALPESRMIFLIRDPRDVAASALDARKKGSWVYERRRDKLGEGETLGGVSPDNIVRSTGPVPTSGTLAA